jgi:hypothetical protein
VQDVEVRDRTLAWLKRAEALQRERNRVVHSIVLHDGWPGWHGYHPKSGSLRRLSTEEIVELAEQARAHADDGVYMSIFEWSRLSRVTKLTTTPPTTRPGQPEPAHPHLAYAHLSERPTLSVLPAA